MATTNYGGSVHLPISINAKSRAKELERYQSEPWGEICQQLVLENILRHPPTDRGLRVMDIGGGNGFYAIAMAKRGCFVEIIDDSDAALDIAYRNVVTAGMGERIRTTRANIGSELPSYRNASFNLVFCHNLIEFIPDYPRLLLEAARLLKVGGILSVVFESRYATAMRLAVRELNPQAALDFLRGEDRIVTPSAISGAGLEPEQVRLAVEQVNLRIIADYGVCIFNNYGGYDRRNNNPELFPAMLELERAAAQMPQYRGIARYRQLLAKKG